MSPKLRVRLAGAELAAIEVTVVSVATAFCAVPESVRLDGSSEQRVNGRAAMHNETAETELCCATHSCEGYVVEDGFCRLG